MNQLYLTITKLSYKAPLFKAQNFAIWEVLGSKFKSPKYLVFLDI